MTVDSTRMVQYRLSATDLFRFNLGHTQYYWNLGAAAVVMMAAVFPRIQSVWNGQASARDERVLWSVLLLFAGILGVVGSAYGVYFWWHASCEERKSLETGGESRLEISPDCLHYTDRRVETQLQWSAISRIRASRGFVCFYVESQPVYIIPRRSFASFQDSEAFLEAARSWHTAAVS